MAHCALGMARVNRLGSSVELQVLLGKFRSCRKRSAILFFPTPWGEEGQRLNPSAQWYTHCTGWCYWRVYRRPPGCPPAGGARPGHSPSACLAVCADAEVKQERHTQLKHPHGQVINCKIMMQEFVVQLLSSITSTTAPLLSVSSIQRIGYTLYVCLYVCNSTVQFIDSRRAPCAECPSWCVSALAHQGAIPVGSHRRVCLGLLLLASEEI